MRMQLRLNEVSCDEVLESIGSESTMAMTIKEFAAELGVSRMTVHRMRKNGELPPTIPTTRRFVRWRESDIELWFDLGCPSACDFDELKHTKQKFARRQRGKR